MLIGEFKITYISLFFNALSLLKVFLEGISQDRLCNAFRLLHTFRAHLITFLCTPEYLLSAASYLHTHSSLHLSPHPSLITYKSPASLPYTYLSLTYQYHSYLSPYLLAMYPLTFLTRHAPTEELSAPVIDGVNMDEVLLVEQGGEIGGTVTFAEDVTFLAGLTADTNILDSCDFGRVSGCGCLLFISV